MSVVYLSRLYELNARFLLSDTNHIVNSSKMELEQIWDSLLLAFWWRLMHLRTVTGLKAGTLIWPICFTSRLGPRVCVCVCFPAVSVCLSHSWMQTWTAAWFFPKLNCLCGFCIMVNHPQASDLLTMIPVWISVIRDRMGSWPWQPRPFPEIPLRLFPVPSLSLSRHLSRIPLSRVRILCGVILHVTLMQAGPWINLRGLTLSLHSDTELSYCRGSLQAKVEAADQGSSPAG